MAFMVSSWRGCSSKDTPPTSAAPISPRRSASQARCSADAEDEQAVSTAMLGPWKSNSQLTRFAIDQ